MNVPLDRNLHIGNVVKNELDETLVVVLSQEFNEWLRFEILTQFDSGQSILGETEIEIVSDCASKRGRGGKREDLAFPFNYCSRGNQEGRWRRTVLTVYGKLFSDLGEIWSTNESDNSLLSNRFQDFENFGRSSLETTRGTAG